LPAALEMNVPFHVPVTEGTNTPLSVPLSPLAHPVPVIEYVPLKALAEPVTLAVMTCEAMLAEVTVMVCPLTVPLIGMIVPESIHAELKIRREPEIAEPD
jgi:hypothetical protein